MQDTIKIDGVFTIELKRNGKVIEKRQGHNLITSAGKAEIANLVGNVSSPAAFTYLEVGIGTTAPTVDDTALESAIVDSGLARAAATVTRETTNVTNDTLQLVKSWTASGAKNVSELGAFNAASDGTMLGRQVFTAIPCVANDVLALTYKFIFS